MRFCLCGSEWEVIERLRESEARVIKQKFREESGFSRGKINRSVAVSKSWDFSVVVSNGKQNTTAKESQETVLAHGR